MKFRMNKLALASSVLFSAFILQACDSGSTTQVQGKTTTEKQVTAEVTAMKMLSTSVIYLDHSVLPPNAVLKVVLEDISKADVISDLISSQSLKVKGTPPYIVNIEYDANKIQKNHRYNLLATIKVKDSLVFISTTHIDPFVEGQTKPIEIKMDRITGAKMAESDNRPNVEFTNTYWKLISLGETLAKLGAGEKELFIQFVAENHVIKGFSGCNNFVGSFEANQGKLALSTVAGTRKMCMKGMEQEQAFLKSIGNFASYSVNGETLTIKNNKDVLVATFESRYMK